MKLIQLVYLSEMVGRDTAVIASILESSVRHNRASGVTGMLLYAEGGFIQALEGDEPDVLATYQRIWGDKRHQYISLLHADEVPERCFGNWSMGFKHLGPQDAAAFPQYAPYFAYGVDPQALVAAPGVALDMLKLFCGGEI